MCRDGAQQRFTCANVSRPAKGLTCCIAALLQDAHAGLHEREHYSLPLILDQSGRKSAFYRLHTSDASGWEDATMPRVPKMGERRLLKSIRLKGVVPPDISLNTSLAPPAML